jgi:hypothetical protein
VTVREIKITPQEMLALRELEIACWANIREFDTRRWLEGCRTILGERMPEVYGPPTRPVVVRSAPARCHEP